MRTAQKSIFAKTILDTDQIHAKPQPDVHATHHRFAA